jgi:hypothetical protein
LTGASAPGVDNLVELRMGESHVRINAGGQLF